MRTAVVNSQLLQPLEILYLRAAYTFLSTNLSGCNLSMQSHTNDMRGEQPLSESMGQAELPFCQYASILHSLTEVMRICGMHTSASMSEDKDILRIAGSGWLLPGFLMVTW